MIKHQGVWLPDGEKHFPEWMTRNGEIVAGRGTYQIKKLRAALEHVTRWRCAVDVGAHVGLWSMQLAPRFEQLHAFEPVEAFRQCWTRNMEGHTGHSLLYPVALGVKRGHVVMTIPPLAGGIDSGGTHVGQVLGEDDTRPQGSLTAPLHALDEFSFEVDFLKVDCEGFELEVLKGARETLERCHPCVIVEQKPHKLGPNFGIKGTPACDYLRTLGAVQRRELSGDFIFSWP